MVVTDFYETLYININFARGYAALQSSRKANKPSRKNNEIKL